jgi:hypothetical protein
VKHSSAGEGLTVEKNTAELARVTPPAEIECALQTVLGVTLGALYHVRADNEDLPDLLGYYIARTRNGMGILVVSTSATPAERLYSGLLLIAHLLLGHMASPYATLIVPRVTAQHPFGNLQGADAKRHRAAVKVFQRFLQAHDRRAPKCAHRNPMEIQVEHYLVQHMRQLIPAETIADPCDTCADTCGTCDDLHAAEREFAVRWQDLVKEAAGLAPEISIPAVTYHVQFVGRSPT